MRRAGIALAILPAILAAACVGQDVTIPGSPNGSGDVVVRLTAGDAGPAGVLEFGLAQQPATLGSYCWTRPGAAGTEAPRCVDAATEPVPADFVDVPRAAVLRVEGDAGSVTATVEAVAKGSDGKVKLELVETLDLTEGSASLDVPPGEYAVVIVASFVQGDVPFSFGIRIA